MRVSVTRTVHNRFGEYRTRRLALEAWEGLLQMTGGSNGNL